MSKTPIDGRHFQYRNGIPSGGGETFYWKGVATKPDLGAQPPDRPRRVVNGRFVGGHIIARPPIVDYNVEVPVIPNSGGLGPYQAEPMFMAEHNPFGGVRLWWAGNIPVGFLSGSETGSSFGYIDSDYDPAFSEVGRYYHSTNNQVSIAKYAQVIYVGELGALKRLYRMEPTPGEIKRESVYSAVSDEVVVAHRSRQVTGLHVHDGKLYYAVTDPANVAVGEIWTWNGVQAVKVYDLAVSGKDGVWMATYKNTLVVTVVGYASICVMAADGTWSTATVAGFAAANSSNNMAEVKGILYIASGADKIHSWNGTALTLVRTVTVGTTPVYLNNLASFNGRLYYTWAESHLLNLFWPWLGVFDPATTKAAYQWKDDYKAIGFKTANTGFADVHYASNHLVMKFAIPSGMVVYRQRLVVALGAPSGSYASAFPTTIFVTHAEENNPYSTWYSATVFTPTFWYNYPTDGEPEGPLSFLMRTPESSVYRWPAINFMKVL